MENGALRAPVKGPDALKCQTAQGWTPTFTSPALQTLVFGRARTYTLKYAQEALKQAARHHGRQITADSMTSTDHPNRGAAWLVQHPLTYSPLRALRHFGSQLGPYTAFVRRLGTTNPLKSVAGVKGLEPLTPGFGVR